MSEKCNAKYPYPNDFSVYCGREKRHDGAHLYRSLQGYFFEWNDEPTPPALGVSVEETVATDEKIGQ